MKIREQITHVYIYGAVCGGEMSGAEGEIRSPGYPHGYAGMRQCEWVIVGPPGKRIKLEFLDFDLVVASSTRWLSVCSDNVQVIKLINFESDGGHWIIYLLCFSCVYLLIMTFEKIYILVCFSKCI